MSKFWTCLAVGAACAFAMPAFAAGQNQTPAQLECTDSAVAAMNAAPGSKDDAMRRAAVEKLTASGQAMMAQARADCLRRMESTGGVVGAM